MPSQQNLRESEPIAGFGWRWSLTERAKADDLIRSGRSGPLRLETPSAPAALRKSVPTL